MVHTIPVVISDYIKPNFSDLGHGSNYHVSDVQTDDVEDHYAVIDSIADDMNLDNFRLNTAHWMDKNNQNHCIRDIDEPSSQPPKDSVDDDLMDNIRIKTKHWMDKSDVDHNQVITYLNEPFSGQAPTNSADDFVIKNEFVENSCVLQNSVMGNDHIANDCIDTVDNETVLEGSVDDNCCMPTADAPDNILMGGVLVEDCTLVLGVTNEIIIIAGVIADTNIKLKHTNDYESCTLVDGQADICSESRRTESVFLDNSSSMNSEAPTNNCGNVTDSKCVLQDSGADNRSLLEHRLSYDHHVPVDIVTYTNCLGLNEDTGDNAWRQGSSEVDDDCILEYTLPDKCSMLDDCVISKDNVSYNGIPVVKLAANWNSLHGGLEEPCSMPQNDMADNSCIPENKITHAACILEDGFVDVETPTKGVFSNICCVTEEGCVTEGSFASFYSVNTCILDAGVIEVDDNLMGCVIRDGGLLCNFPDNCCVPNNCVVGCPNKSVLETSPIENNDGHLLEVAFADQKRRNLEEGVADCTDSVLERRVKNRDGLKKVVEDNCANGYDELILLRNLEELCDVSCYSALKFIPQLPLR